MNNQSDLLYYQYKLNDIWTHLFPNLIECDSKYTSSIDKAIRVLNKIDSGNTYRRSSLLTIDKNNEIFLNLVIYPIAYENLYNIIINMIRKEKLKELME